MRNEMQVIPTVPITDAEAFDSLRWTHKHDDLIQHLIDQIGHPGQHLDAIAHELAAQPWARWQAHTKRSPLGPRSGR